MQQLIDRSTVPPDGFRAFQAETRTWVRGGDFYDLFVKIKKHRLANNIPIGPVWEAEVEDQLCRMLPPGFCKEQQPNRLPVNVSTRLPWRDIERAAQVFVNWAIAGAPTVSQEEADRRAQICASCYLNVGGDSGCRTCGSSVNFIKRAIGNRKTSSEIFLKTCAICKCFNAVQVWFPIDQLAKGVSPQMTALWPDFCWKGLQLKEAGYGS